MIIQLEFCGLTKLMEVPEQVSGLVELDWIPDTVMPALEISDGVNAKVTSNIRLIFTYAGNKTEQGYMIYNMTHLNKINYGIPSS